MLFRSVVLVSRVQFALMLLQLTFGLRYTTT
jgi:hypothetical protein